MLTHRVTFVIWPLLFLHVSAQTWSLFPNQPKGKPQDGSLRLVGTDLPSAGRVEVYHNGQWGTVCDDGWDVKEAQVVCRQLGFPGAVSVTIGGSNGEGTGPIWIDDISCTGSESSLASCSFKGWGITDCTHKEDVGVVCEAAKGMDSDSRVSLDHSLGLSGDLGALFDSGEDCDVSVLVRDPSEEQDEQQTICAHRLILRLHPQFNLNKTSTSLSVEISQSCHPYVTSFFRYLYTRKIDVTTSSAQCLHQLAHMFEFKQLLEEVGRVFTLLLPQDSTFHTQVALYEYGVHTKDLLLQENVLQYLSWNFESLVMSAVWKSISVGMMKGLLSRSDVVVRDEGFLLEALEDWIKEKGNSISEECKISLLKQVRFEMIPVEKLYDIQFNSGVYHRYEAIYHETLLKGFQFNTLPFSLIKAHFNTSESYLPRIYTASPWSVVINTTSNSYYDYRYNFYSSGRALQFSAPAHNSLLFKQQSINWQAQILLHSGECSNQGFQCESVPMARLFSSYSSYSSDIRYNNRLILTCKTENTVFHVQDFKNDKAVIQTNSTNMNLPNPCSNDYMYTFVVRPEYV